MTKTGVSLPDELIAFADREAARRGTTRSALLAGLLEAERIREQTRRYDVQKVLRSDFLKRLGTLPVERAAALSAGLRLVLDL